MAPIARAYVALHTAVACRLLRYSNGGARPAAAPWRLVGACGGAGSWASTGARLGFTGSVAHIFLYCFMGAFAIGF